MIFVTVGEQLPFDRLIQTVDEWAKDAKQEVRAQIGKTKFLPCYLRYQQLYSLHHYRQLFESADLVIGHAGMGTIITAVELHKPLLIMPRRKELGEHRNNHQMETAQRFFDLPVITVAWDEKELENYLIDLAILISTRQLANDLGANSRLIENLKQIVISCVDKEQSYLSRGA